MKLKQVPTVEQCVKEDALEVQDIRQLGLGWAWFMNDLRAFLPAWQEMELASPSSEEPVTQIEADVPIEPLALHCDATAVDLDLQVYERPLAVTPFGLPEDVPNWQDTHVMHSLLNHAHLGKWIRTDLSSSTEAWWTHSALYGSYTFKSSFGREGVPPPFQKLTLLFAAPLGQELCHLCDSSLRMLKRKVRRRLV